MDGFPFFLKNQKSIFSDFPPHANHKILLYWYSGDKFEGLFLIIKKLLAAKCSALLRPFMGKKSDLVHSLFILCLKVCSQFSHGFHNRHFLAICSLKQLKKGLIFVSLCNICKNQKKRKNHFPIVIKNIYPCICNYYLS